MLRNVSLVLLAKFGLIAALSLVCGACATLAQDPAQDAAKANSPDAEAPPADARDEAPAAFADVLAEWNRNDQEISAIVAKFREASPDEQAALRKSYGELVGKANKILVQLRKAGMAEYDAKPNADPQVTRTLLGILGNDLKSDDYGAASELAQLLASHKCEDKRLPLMAGYAAFGTNRFEDAKQYFQQAAEAGQIDQEAESYLMGMDGFIEAWRKETAIREQEAAADDLPRVKLTTNKGTIVIELFENQAPQAVGNFISLVEKKYYNGLTFHRVLAGFMAQGGCPNGDGAGGPGYKIYCECGREDYRHHFTGTLSMAHAGKDTGGSQFFLTFRPTPHLDSRHTAFGRVIEGFEVLPKLQRRDPRSRIEPDKILSAEVIRKRDHDYQPKKVE